MKIVTATFRQSAARCGRDAALGLAARWWWAFALPLVCALIASLWDWRFLVAGFGVALVAYPFVMMMAYYGSALTPRAAKALLPRRVEIGDDGIDVIYEPHDDGSAAHAPEHFSLAGLAGYEDRGDTIVVKHAEDDISIPASALDREGMASLMAFLERRG